MRTPIENHSVIEMQTPVDLPRLIAKFAGIDMLYQMRCGPGD